MACSKLFSFTVLAMVIFLSSSSKRFAVASRILQTDSPDIPNFGFPELWPPLPELPFLPPKNELEPFAPSDPESSPPAPKDRQEPASPNIPNFGFPEFSPPVPELPFLPPRNELEPFAPTDPKSSPPAPKDEREPSSPNIPNFGFPELSPPAPRFPFLPNVPEFPPKADLLVASKIKLKPSSPTATKIPQIVRGLRRESLSPVPSVNGPEPQEAN